MLSKLPKSCDTFVVMPPLTKNNTVIFGKNSDRPSEEVQEVIYVKGGQRRKTVECTYIKIAGVSPVNSVILSKPAWMWGAEMGANDKNVVIGNEAVWTNYCAKDADATRKRLLGTDLVRLGLERGDTAEGALDIITALLEKYGQGGPAAEGDTSYFHHNSFLIADPTSAWILETCGKLWAAEKVESGYRNISNCLSITTKIDKHSVDLQQKVKDLYFWNGEEEFDFAGCLSSGGDDGRQSEGKRMIQAKLDLTPPFSVQDMMFILRDKESTICRGISDEYPTQGSQVSCLSATNVNVHWFTCTPDPCFSFYKPFVFSPNPVLPTEIISPRKKGLKWEHQLYKMHVDRIKAGKHGQTARGCKMLEMERHAQMDKYLNTPAGQSSLEELDTLLKDCVDDEINLHLEDTDDDSMDESMNESMNESTSE